MVGSFRTKVIQADKILSSLPVDYFADCVFNSQEELMKRLYFLTRDIDAADEISERLHKAGITDWNFHVLSKNKSELHRHRLHATTPLQELDIIRGGEIGVIVGVLAGAIAALVFLRVGFDLNWLGFSAAVVLFALFGTWLGGMIGVSSENYKIRRFHNFIERGYLLLMVDVAKDQQKGFMDIISLYPTVSPAGEDTTVVNPFAKPVES
jgi:hypothetical protein